MTLTPAAPQPSRSALGVLFTVVFINLVGFGIVVPLLPFYGQTLDAPPWQVALMFSAYSLGQFVAEPFWGRLSDRIGRKPVILITVLANAAGYLALAFVPNIWLAIAVRLFTGLGGLLTRPDLGALGYPLPIFVAAGLCLRAAPISPIRPARNSGGVTSAT